MIDIMQKMDFSRLPKGTVLIFTDFAASMNLRARQAMNSSVDAHCVNCNMVAIYNAREIEVTEKKVVDGVEVEVVSKVADRQGGESEEIERFGNERSRKLPGTQVRIAQTQPEPPFGPFVVGCG